MLDALNALKFFRAAEAMNGALFLDISFAIMMFGTYAFSQIRLYGYVNRARAQAAISICVLLVGEAILRATFWLLRFQTSNGWDTTWINAWPITQVGMTIELLGVLCLIRVFTPDKWNPRTWLGIGILSALVSVVVAFAFGK